ncbi:MAG TPA: efflux RND transporter periplasmic adaptor subunit [Steroidobacteraceae bacterium]|nr:efflux RND transporter periplasmic adaptor subunit [Steroidobacteraceae bacterium]
MKHLPLPLAGPIATALLLLAGCGGAGQPAANVARPATPVGIARAELGAASRRLALHGVVASRDELKLSFKVGGLIRSIAVRPGDSVRRGQQLAEIQLAEVDAQLTQAQALEARAARDLERGEHLYAEQVITLEQLQNLRTQHQVAAAQLSAVRFNRGQSVITAPADGVVLRRLAEEHEVVAPGQPVLLISDAASGTVVRAAVSDRDLLQLHRGDAATVRLDADPSRTLPGRLIEISRAADPATGLFPVVVAVPAPGTPLASGMVATVQIEPPAGGAQRVHIPLGAVVAAAGNKADVFVLDGDIARKRAVQIDFIDDSDVALSSGLAAGTTVITDGASYLDDNARVKVATP